jgi:hypothetical protein
VSASPHELAPAASDSLKQVPAQPRPSKRAGSTSHCEDRDANGGSETAAGSSARDLSAVEGLVAADGLARVDGDSKLYFKALQQFVQEKAGASDKIREALLRGDLAAAGPAHRPPAPPPVNPSKLRKAVNAILPLLTDQDPGAKDCLKANRAAFRSAFSSEAFSEFEQFIKESDLGAALEQLRRAAKKHGISV